MRVGVLTATRAEYGLMRPLIFRLNEDEDIELKLLVTGTHLVKEYGMTVREILDDGVPIEKSIDILSFDKYGAVDVAATMAKAIVLFSEYFSKKEIDALLVDGDRYETAAICMSAINSNIPIIHCGGGETTEGANDEYWRHVITKMSILHFPTMERYARRIISMGEAPDHVCVSGSLGVENICQMKLGRLSEVEERIGISLNKPYALVTFHPVTLENNTAAEQIEELLKVCNTIDDMKFIFTMANSDNGGNIINDRLKKYCKKNNDRTVFTESLGSYMYFTAMKHCEFVMGNSSSGIIETPTFGIPTINIGDRQKGREQAGSIINCEPKSSEILMAVKKARTSEFREYCKSVDNPNGDGKASEIIVKKIKSAWKEGKVVMQKHFYEGMDVM